MISILIPAFNEAERIEATIHAIRGAGAPLADAQIVVIDDGSTDETAIAAERAGADTVLRQTNRGKGAALMSGLPLARGGTILLLDADLGATAAEAVKLVGPVRSGAAQMAIATFPVTRGVKGGAGLVVRLARWGIRALTGQTMAAPLSGQRALSRALLEEIGGFAAGWGVEVALTVEALRTGARVIEVPTQMSHRVTGRTMGAILHRAAQFFAAARTLIALWLRRPAARLPAR